MEVAEFKTGWGAGGRMILALVLLQLIESGFNILGVSPYLTMALWGALLLAFIWLKGRGDPQHA